MQTMTTLKEELDINTLKNIGLKLASSSYSTIINNILPKLHKLYSPKYNITNAMKTVSDPKLKFALKIAKKQSDMVISEINEQVKSISGTSTEIKQLSKNYADKIIDNIKKYSKWDSSDKQVMKIIQLFYLVFVPFLGIIITSAYNKLAAPFKIFAILPNLTLSLVLFTLISIFALISIFSLYYLFFKFYDTNNRNIYAALKDVYNYVFIEHEDDEDIYVISFIISKLGAILLWITGITISAILLNFATIGHIGLMITCIVLTLGSAVYSLLLLFKAVNLRKKEKYVDNPDI